MKFKVGDKVKIKKAMFEFDKKYEGKVVTINWIDPYDEHRYRDKENGKNWRSCELELVEVKEEIILKGVKKAKGYYEVEMPKHNGYIWSYVANDKIILQLNEEILDDIEKEYLRAVIKPFRDRVKYILKNHSNMGEYITICVFGEFLNFPYFFWDFDKKRLTFFCISDIIFKPLNAERI